MMQIEPAKEPIPAKEWHRHLHSMMTIGELNPDIIPYLDSYQMFCINEIKKYFARLEYQERRQGDNPDENENDTN